MKFLLLFFLSLPTFASLQSCYEAIKKSDVKWMASQFQPVPSAKIDFINSFQEVRERYVPYWKIRLVVKEKNLQIIFSRPGEKNCPLGTLALYIPPDTLSICQDETQTIGTILESFVHEALHWAQDRGLELTPFVTVFFEGQDRVFEVAREYTVNPKVISQLRENQKNYETFLSSIPKEKARQLKEFFEKLTRLERYYIIKTLPLSLGFLPKIPAGVSDEVFRSKLTPDILGEVKSAGEFYLSFLNAHRKDHNLISKLKEVIYRSFTENSQLSIPSKYCQETQAQIITEVLRYIRFFEVRNLPECTKLYPHSLTQYQSFDALEKAMVDRADKFVTMSPKLSIAYSEIWGLSGFPEVFHRKKCFNINSDY